MILTLSLPEASHQDSRPRSERSPVLFFSGPHPQPVDVPRLGVELELQLLAYTTATGTQDPSHIFDLHHSSWQHRILNPLRDTRDRIHVLTDTSRVHNPLSHNRNSLKDALLSLLSLCAWDPRHCGPWVTRGALRRLGGKGQLGLHHHQSRPSGAEP